MASQVTRRPRLTTKDGRKLDKGLRDENRRGARVFIKRADKLSKAT